MRIKNLTDNELIPWILIGVGALLIPFSFVTGIHTLAYCEFGGFYGRIYELIGIYPPKYTVTIDWSELSVSWFDGCNTHNQSLIPSAIGFTILVFGVGLYIRCRKTAASS